MRWPHHPFPVTCTFRRCILVNFAVDPATLAQELPSGLEPHVVDDRSFVAIVIGQMEKMRPAGLPRSLGITYNQIVYRAVIRRNGQLGVHFLRSDTDNRLMCALGDRMSFFRFHRSAIGLEQVGDCLRVEVNTADQPGADINACFELAGASTAMPSSSRFVDLPSAREHVVELFTAYDLNAKADTMESVTIDRDPWDVQVLPTVAGKFEFMEAGPIFDKTTAKLDSVLSVSDVRYRWDRLQRQQEHLAPTAHSCSAPACLERA